MYDVSNHQTDVINWIRNQRHRCQFKQSILWTGIVAAITIAIYIAPECEKENQRSHVLEENHHQRHLLADQAVSSEKEQAASPENKGAAAYKDLPQLYQPAKSQFGKKDASSTAAAPPLEQTGDSTEQSYPAGKPRSQFGENTKITKHKTTIFNRVDQSTFRANKRFYPGGKEVTIFNTVAIVNEQEPSKNKQYVLVDPQTDSWVNSTSLIIR